MKRLFASCVATMAVALIVGVFGGVEPSAYSVNGPTWPQGQMSYLVNETNLDLPGLSAASAVRSGADAWLQQSGAFRFVYGGSSSQTTNTFDSVNLVMFRNASSGSAIATTYYWTSGGRIVDADVVFWDGAFTFFSGSSGCAGGFYIEDIAAHEFGHALGLGHSASLGATMYPSVSACNTSNRTLDADDIAGVRSIYPIQITAPTGLRVVM
jgi:Matrixin